MTPAYVNGQTIHARARDWTIVHAPEGDVDMLVADPHFTDQERARMQRIEKVNEAGRTYIPNDVHLQRVVLDLSEIEPLAVA